MLVVKDHACILLGLRLQLPPLGLSLRLPSLRLLIRWRSFNSLISSSICKQRSLWRSMGSNKEMWLCWRWRWRWRWTSWSLKFVFAQKQPVEYFWYSNTCPLILCQDVVLWASPLPPKPYKSHQPAQIIVSYYCLIVVHYIKLISIWCTYNIALQWCSRCVRIYENCLHWRLQNILPGDVPVPPPIGINANNRLLLNLNIQQSLIPHLNGESIVIRFVLCSVNQRTLRYMLRHAKLSHYPIE